MKSHRDRKPNSLLNSDHKPSRRRFDKPDQKRSVEEKELKFRSIPYYFKQSEESSDKNQEVKLSGKRIYQDKTEKQMSSRLWEKRVPTPDRITTLHEIQTNDDLVNIRYEESKNSYLNLFGYRPSYLDSTDKFSGFNKLEA